MLRSICVFAALLCAVPATVADSPSPAIEVISQSVESHFPDDCTFTAQVRSDAGDIVDAAIYYRLGWDEAERIGRPEPFAPAAEVTLTHVWDTSGETVPPFIEIAYYWRIVDSAGNEFVTGSVQAEYVDHTHDWQSLRDEHVIVYWYDRPADFGEALFEAAAEGYDHVASVTGVTTERPARVVVYNNRRDFCTFYAPNSCQDWVGGQALSGITVQHGIDQEWLVYEVVPHELAHVFYNEIFRDTWVRVPTWFNEGIAVYNERIDHERDEAIVAEAAAHDELIPLRHMGTQASGLARDAVHLWYAEAYSLVAFIVDVYGEEKLGQVILTLADNHPMEGALQLVLDMDLIEFEMAWRSWLGHPVDVIPTPVRVVPTMISPIPLSTVPREKPTATLTPTPVVPVAALSTPTPASAAVPFSFPCCISPGAVLVATLSWILLVRRRFT
jgi:hypothetical protein